MFKVMLIATPIRMLTYANVCRCMLTYAACMPQSSMVLKMHLHAQGLRSGSEAASWQRHRYAHVFSRMLTYAHVCSLAGYATAYGKPKPVAFVYVNPLDDRQLAR